MNLRYLLIGASLRPLFKGKGLRHRLSFMHLVTDENWAMTMAADRKGEASIGHLFGGGLCVYLFWSVGTLGGHSLGAAISNPEAFALDFAFIAVFLALVTGLWRDLKSDLLPLDSGRCCCCFMCKLSAGKMVYSGGWYQWFDYGGPFRQGGGT